MRRVMLVAVLALGLGCPGPTVEKKDVIALDQVPENVMKVAKDKLPGVTFDRAWKKANGEFEVSGKDRTGKVREIDIKPNGDVVEIE